MAFTRVRDERSPPPAGVRLDDAARAQAAGDFGGLVRHWPLAVFSPTSEDEVAAAIAWARAEGLKVAPQGRRHSTYGRAQARGGLVLDMGRLNAVHAVADDHVVVGAGATWRAVLDATLPRGLTPPVLTDYLDLSIGGTLSVGGVGPATLRRGVQTDHVRELAVVTGAGRRTRCSPAADADLFDAVRAGLGQAAVITQATLPLVRAPRYVRACTLAYGDLPTMLADARRLAADVRFDAVQGFVAAGADGWTFRIEAAAYVDDHSAPSPDAEWLAGLADDRSQAKLVTQSYVDHLDRLALLERTLRSNGRWGYPHPWLMTFVGGSAVESIVAGELASLAPADLGALGQIVVSPLRRPAVSTPLLRLPDEDLVFTCNFVRLPDSPDLAAAQRQVEANRAAYERIRRAGGMLYPVSAMPMSADDWRAHFGPRWPAFAAAKQAFDPDHRLTPGYDVF